MIVYLAYNKESGRYYVGKTCRTLNHRWRRHIASAKSKDKYPFHRALNKYGEHAFELQVLGTATSEQQLNELEKLWIILLQANNRAFGYNVTSGGEGVTGSRHSEEFKVAASKRLLEYHPWKGKHHTDASKQLMRLAKLGKKQPPELIRKRVQVNTGKKRTPEQTQRIKAAQNRPEVLEKMSKSIKAMHARKHK